MRAVRDVRLVHVNLDGLKWRMSASVSRRASGSDAGRQCIRLLACGCNVSALEPTRPSLLGAVARAKSSVTPQETSAL